MAGEGMRDGAPAVLVVDDDAEIRDLLARYLETQGMRAATAPDRASCLRHLAGHRVDLVVLDVMLPDGSGVDLCRDLRRGGSTVPVILLTALRDEVDRVVGLEVGADDYMGKPFGPRELVARIRAVLRRQDGAGKAAVSRVHRFGGHAMETGPRRVTSPMGEVGLTEAEFDLLEALVSGAGRVLSRDMLVEATRGRVGEAVDRSVDVLVSRIRRKLADTGATRAILTVRNGGYLFCVPVRTTLAAG